MTEAVDSLNPNLGNLPRATPEGINNKINNRNIVEKFFRREKREPEDIHKTEITGENDKTLSREQSHENAVTTEASIPSQDKTSASQQIDKELLGDFTDESVANFTIQLTPEIAQEANTKAREHGKKNRFNAPSLRTGNRTAAEYDIRTDNFSTRTAILKLADDRRVFAVYNYPSSNIHRGLDALSKRLSGEKMTKASSRNWKERFLARSNLPTIPSPDPRLVLMPYIDNINGYDALANNKDIKNFGVCSWGNELNLDKKIKLGEAVIQKLKETHGSGKTWGETILPNIIFTKEEHPIIVDPETSYDKNVPIEEQKARDLHDILRSIAGALHKSEGISDYSDLIPKLLTQYPDETVIASLKKVIGEKPSLIQKLATPYTNIYQTVRLGIDNTERKKVDQAILAYNSPQTKTS